MKNVENIVKRIGLFVEAVENRLELTDNLEYTLINNTTYKDKTISTMLIDKGISAFSASVRINAETVQIGLQNSEMLLIAKIDGKATTINDFDTKEDMLPMFKDKVDLLVSKLI